MRILEILLPKGTSDRSLSPQVVRKIDALQRRMDTYVDKIMDPNTSQAGREFLKSRLRDDYYELRNAIPRTHAVAENEVTVQYEVYDRKTNIKVGGPYATAKRARGVRDKKDLEYGAVRYGVRPVGGTSITEAVTKLPLSHDDFELVKKIMEKPIPAAIAPIYIQEIIEDDELNDQLMALEDSNPGLDVRPLIVEWFNRVMPDQMYRFTDEQQTMAQKNGVLSPVHGYDSKQYRGTNDPLTGNAFGYY
jgi:hypothetical protein